MDDRTSTTTYVVLFLDPNIISWSYKKQKTIARSSIEAEYRAIASTAAEFNWLMNLLSELHVALPSSLVVYCDNVGANPFFHSRMKHIAIDFYFVRDQVVIGRLAHSLKIVMIRPQGKKFPATLQVVVVMDLPISPLY